VPPQGYPDAAPHWNAPPPGDPDLQPTWPLQPPPGAPAEPVTPPTPWPAQPPAAGQHPQQQPPPGWPNQPASAPPVQSYPPTQAPYGAPQQPGWSDQPVSAQPGPSTPPMQSVPPVSPVPPIPPVPDPYGAPPPGWSNQPVSAQPGPSPVAPAQAFPIPVQPGPYDQPQPAWPAANQPVSAQPGPSPAPWTPQGAPADASWPQQPGGGAPARPWSPKDDPTPKPRRHVLFTLIGLLIGLVLFAPAGYFGGDLLFGKKAGGDPAGPGPSASATTLPPYEATQAELNRSMFSGDMAAMAEPWLPYLSRCQRNGEAGAPKLAGNERVRITCQVGSLSIFFVDFKTAEDKDQEFSTRKQQNTDAQQLAPGAAAPEHRAGTSGKNTGNYVEFAFKPQGGNASPYVGLWWDRDGSTTLAARIEAQWQGTLNQKWEPMRDIWKRYS
jgi:hypothetical protein